MTKPTQPYFKKGDYGSHYTIKKGELC